MSKLMFSSHVAIIFSLFILQTGSDFSSCYGGYPAFFEETGNSEGVMD